ncbi:tryptophan synthase subunit(beta) [Streptomyces sp. NPDC051639]|uniref:tryptophan biosynthesis modulator TrpM n=1 Tax=unclassified Streptomyces TaxID=2593676 RepID=UPI002E36DF5C|nr:MULTISPECIES: tryptophan synthase subunit(beta) [unclassified Streptomyces]
MATPTHALAVPRPGPRPDGGPARVRSAAPGPAHDVNADRLCARSAVTLPPASAARDPYARLARGCRPRGCRAPARRVHGRRVRYVIGDEPGQVNGMRWRLGARALASSPTGSVPQTG